VDARRELVEEIAQLDDGDLILAPELDRVRHRVRRRAVAVIGDVEEERVAGFEDERLLVEPLLQAILRAAWSWTPAMAELTR